MSKELAAAAEQCSDNMGRIRWQPIANIADKDEEIDCLVWLRDVGARHGRWMPNWPGWLIAGEIIDCERSSHFVRINTPPRVRGAARIGLTRRTLSSVLISHAKDWWS